MSSDAHDVYCCYDPSSNNELVREIILAVKQKNFMVCALYDFGERFISKSTILLCFLTKPFSLNNICISDVKSAHKAGKNVVYVLLEPMNLACVLIDGKTLENEMTVDFCKNYKTEVLCEQLTSLIKVLVEHSMKLDAFISYKKSDSFNIVSNVHDRLSKTGLKLWFDKNQVDVGDNLSKEISVGLQKSIVFLCFISKSYSEAYFCEKEYSFAFIEKKPPIFLVLERDIDIAPNLKLYMSDFKRLDVYKQNGGCTLLDETSLEKLQANIKKIRTLEGIRIWKNIKFESNVEMTHMKTEELIKESVNLRDSVNRTDLTKLKTETNLRNVRGIFATKDDAMKQHYNKFEEHRAEVTHMNREIANEQNSAENQYERQKQVDSGDVKQKLENLDEEKACLCKILQTILLEQDDFIRKEKKLTEGLLKMSKEQSKLILKQIELGEKASEAKILEKFTIERERNILLNSMEEKEKEREQEREMIKALSLKLKEVSLKIDRLEESQPASQSSIPKKSLRVAFRRVDKSPSLIRTGSRQSLRPTSALSVEPVDELNQQHNRRLAGHNSDGLYSSIEAYFTEQSY